jgi:serine phosphatase RsbU (regulator of sigma subunit)
VGEEALWIEVEEMKVSISVSHVSLNSMKSSRTFDVEQILGPFKAMLRAEVDPEKLSENILSVVQQTLQPRSLSLWLRTPITSSDPSMQTSWSEQLWQMKVTKQDYESQALQKPDANGGHAAIFSEINLAPNDPLVVYFLSHSGVLRVNRVNCDSPALRRLQAVGMELSIPLISQEELLGVLNIGPSLSGRHYSLDERTLLTRIATHAPSALRVASMVQAQERLVRENERFEQELRTAHFIQQSLLPENVPTLPGWQITPYYQPAREVGGDFYDVLQFDDGLLGLVIGDVSGKGVPAALVMAITTTMLRTAVRGIASPGKVLARVNELLLADIPSKMFVTCFYMLLDPSSGRLRYANAGHELPYRRSAKSVIELRATGLPLGMIPGSSYEEYEAMLLPGESLLFYTDGLVEAHNQRREMFDYPRLSALIAGYAGGSALIELLLNALARFTGEQWEQEDDVTMVVVSRGASTGM